MFGFLGLIGFAEWGLIVMLSFFKCNSLAGLLLCIMRGLGWVLAFVGVGFCLCLVLGFRGFGHLACLMGFG